MSGWNNFTYYAEQMLWFVVFLVFAWQFINSDAPVWYTSSLTAVASAVILLSNKERRAKRLKQLDNTP